VEAGEEKRAVEILVSQHIDAAHALVPKLLDHAALLRHDGSDHQIHVITLYASVLEMMSSCVVLAKAGETVGIPILLRPMYEALVDLDNLVHDHSYIEYLESANLKQLLKLLSAAKAGNPWLDGFVDSSPEFSKKMGERFAELKTKGKGPLTIESKCRKTGRLAQYESFYALVCLDSHNNSAALADRHIQGESNGVPQVSIFKIPDPAALVRRMEFAMDITVNAAVMIHGAF
jgi:hypothetical protein